MYAWQFQKMLQLPVHERARAVRHHAEPLQPRLSRGRARDDSALPRPEDRLHSVEPAGARLPHRQPQARRRQDRKPSAPAPTTSATASTIARRTSTSSTASLELATQRNVKPAQIALAWILSKPVVSAPIIGASKLYQLEDALGALELKLTPDEIPPAGGTLRGAQRIRSQLLGSEKCKQLTGKPA